MRADYPAPKYTEMDGLWWKRYRNYAATVEERDRIMSTLSKQGWLVFASPQRLPKRRGVRYAIWISKPEWHLNRPCPFKQSWGKEPRRWFDNYPD
jgi:hypothetical protein